jgi:hypothetical protein
MRELIANDPRNSECIFPFMGSDEVNNDPRQAHHRYVIDFFDRPLRRDPGLQLWATMDDDQRSACRTRGVVPGDYLGEVAEDWPDLVEIVRRRVKPERDKQKRKPLRERWWQFADKRPGLYAAIAPLERVPVTGAAAAAHHTIALVARRTVFSHKLIVFALDGPAALAVLQSRCHEHWSREFGSTIGEGLTYNPTQVFRTFPFPEGFLTVPDLNEVGEAYDAYRSALMVERNDGLTKTYNRFHDRREMAADVVRLRELHDEMDRAVLAAYGWRDLAKTTAPAFRPREDDPDKTHLDWPQRFKDEVLDRLLKLNAKRPHAESNDSASEEEQWSCGQRTAPGYATIN